MAFETDRRPIGGFAQPRTWADAGEVDLGLRKYLLGVYNYMASGLLLSGIVALLVATQPSVTQMFFTVHGNRLGYTGLGMLAVFAPLGLIMYMSYTWRARQTSTLKLLYWLFVGLMGVSLGTLGLVYTGTSIARTFFVTAIAFGGLSLYGYTTKRDLSGMATFLMMGLIGIVIASLINMFVHSTMTQFVISVVGVLVFAGLTAYDTQNLKRVYYSVGGSGAEENSAIMGAVQLYLNFVNLFQMLLMFMGDRR